MGPVCFGMPGPSALVVTHSKYVTGALPGMLQWRQVSGKIEGMANEPMPSTAIRRGLADILIRVHRGEHIPITHYDRPAAVMVPPDWYEKALAAMNGNADGR